MKSITIEQSQKNIRFIKDAHKSPVGPLWRSLASRARWKRHSKVRIASYKIDSKVKVVLTNQNQ